MDDSQELPFRNPDLPLKARVEDLIGRLSLEEKVSQMLFASLDIERLGIPAYNWWSECLHGVGRAGLATVFPQAIGLAATWNPELLDRVAVSVSDEARAKHHQALREGLPDEQYFGLTFFSPNINIFRDPRWGRGQETYGEDPYLTARLGVAFVRGLQGDHPRYLKLAATPKHFAVHSGPEHERHSFNAEVSLRDLRETYLPAFEACVREAGAASVMGAYNRTNGEACCASPTLLQEILRQEWGFTGYVVSDCWAVRDIYTGHRLARTAPQAAAMAVNAGCDLNCGEIYGNLPIAVARGWVSEDAIDTALRRLLTVQFRLGMFDPPESVPYAQIPYEIVDSQSHRDLALQAARESLVLLKNDGLLPLDREKLKTIAVIGPNADDETVMLGNYHGEPSHIVTPLAGLREAAGADTRVLYAPGCSVIGRSQAGFESALQAAGQADVVIAVVGLSQVVEGEEGQEEGVAAGLVSMGDRTSLDLPGEQEAMLQALHATGKPLVVILINGGAVAVRWAEEHAAAILEAWYPGQAGGTAIAEALFGDYNPGGRLPVTFYRSVDQLPPFRDYDMQGRTYRYFNGPVMYPFGFGLSYTTFSYRDLRILPERVEPGQAVKVSVEVQNTGGRNGDEVVQLYITSLDASASSPIRQLSGFRRLHLAEGEVEVVRFNLEPGRFSLFDEAGHRQFKPGRFEISVGGGQPGGTAPVVSGQLEIFGS